MGTIELSGNADDKYLKMQRSTKTGDARWKDIEDLINRWAKRQPLKAMQLQSHIAGLKTAAKDKKFGFIEGPRTGKVGGGGTRLGIALDEELLQYIEAFYPDFLKTKEDLHEFERRFPKFLIPEKN